MRPLSILRKPEYIFRPSQIFRRLQHSLETSRLPRVVQLPWGHLIHVNPAETVGSCIVRQGVYDIAGCELIWRLLDRGETAIDIGANLGQMTSLMAKRLGQSGRVISFEPHPTIFAELSKNVLRWQSDIDTARVECMQSAVSDEVGEVSLYMPDAFKGNQGVASLVEGVRGTSTRCLVRACRLDDVLESNAKFGVMKIDVEGHELQALQGGSQLLKAGLIRDIVFEEHATLPTAVTIFLSNLGYSIFYIFSTLFKPKLISTSLPYQVQRGDAPNYLATLDPNRALKKVEPYGWHCIRAS